MPRVKRGMIVDALWCPRAESNHDLMITNQLHDLHATGADRAIKARIIAQATASRALRRQVTRLRA